jgi:hypothetical protein
VTKDADAVDSRQGGIVGDSSSEERVGNERRERKQSLAVDMRNTWINDRARAKARHSETTGR